MIWKIDINDIHFEPPEIPVEEMSASCELISSSLPQS